MGNWAFEILAEFILKNEKTQAVQIFQGMGLLPTPSLRKIQQESSARSEETIHKLKSKFSIFAKIAIIRPLTSRYFWAWLKFNTFASFDPLMANDGALKSSHQDGLNLGLLARGRHNYKNKLPVYIGQTESM